MGQFRVKVEDLAKKHIAKHSQSGKKSVIKKIERILYELSEHPYVGTGNPEQLKYELTGFWSRRINQKDRMIYKVEEDIVTVYVVSAMGHYDDK